MRRPLGSGEQAGHAGPVSQTSTQTKALQEYTGLSAVEVAARVRDQGVQLVHVVGDELLDPARGALGGLPDRDAAQVSGQPDAKITVQAGVREVRQHQPGADERHPDRDPDERRPQPAPGLVRRRAAHEGGRELHARDHRDQAGDSAQALQHNAADDQPAHGTDQIPERHDTSFIRVSNQPLPFAVSSCPLCPRPGPVRLSPRRPLLGRRTL